MAIALIWPLAWELPYAVSATLKRKKKKLNTIPKNSIEGINSVLQETEEGISEVEERLLEFTDAEKNKEKNN